MWLFRGPPPLISDEGGARWRAATRYEVVDLPEAMKKVLDAVDIETFLVCEDAGEARRLALGLVAEMGLARGDVVFLEMCGPGARVRVRAYVHRPGDRYGWLSGGQT